MATPDKGKKPGFLRRYDYVKDYQKKPGGGYDYTGNWISCTLPAEEFRAVTGRALVFALVAVLATLLFGLLPYRSNANIALPGTQFFLNSSVFVLLPWAISLVIEITLLARTFRLRREGPALKLYVYNLTASAVPGMARAAIALAAIALLFFIIDFMRKTTLLSAAQTMLGCLCFGVTAVCLLLYVRRLSKLTYIPGKR